MTCSGCSGNVERGDGDYDELPDEVSPANPNWHGARAATAGELAFAAGVLAEQQELAAAAGAVAKEREWLEEVFAGVMSAPMSLAELTELCEEAGRAMTEAEAEGYRRRRDKDVEAGVATRRRRGSR